MWILKNITKTRKLLKKGLKVCTGRFVYFLQVMTSYQDNIRLLTDDSSENAEFDLVFLSLYWLQSAERGRLRFLEPQQMACICWISVSAMTRTWTIVTHWQDCTVVRHGLCTANCLLSWCSTENRLLVMQNCPHDSACDSEKRSDFEVDFQNCHSNRTVWLQHLLSLPSTSDWKLSVSLSFPVMIPLRQWFLKFFDW